MKTQDARAPISFTNGECPLCHEAITHPHPQLNALAKGYKNLKEAVDSLVGMLEMEKRRGRRERE